MPPVRDRSRHDAGACAASFASMSRIRRTYKTAESGGKIRLWRQLFASAEALMTALAAALPWYLKTSGAKRRETGFAVTRIRNLLGDHADEFVGPWLVQTRHLVRARRA